MANKTRLIEVRDKILANKDRFYYGRWAKFIDDSDMNAWRFTPEREIAAQLEHNCNTCGCVAGWTYTCIEKPIECVPIAANAEIYLELEEDDYWFLFVGRPGHGLDEIDIHQASVWDAIQRLNLLIDLETEREDVDAIF